MAAETYEGVPCRRAGHTTRYVRGGNCVPCSNDGRLRAHRIKRLYGLSADEESAMWEATQGICTICGKPMQRTGKISSSRAVVDHSHVTGKVRDIICNGCNRGLGYFGDDPEILENAAGYLRLHED